MRMIIMRRVEFQVMMIKISVDFMMKLIKMMTAIFPNPESKTCLSNHNDDETSKGLQAGASWHMVLALGLLTDVT